MTNDKYHALKKTSNKKIHICYNVKELNRITDKWMEIKPDIIIYFVHNGKIGDQHMDNFYENCKFKDEHLPDAVLINPRVDYLDFYAIMEHLGRIFSIARRNNHKISINLATGSKMVAMANLTAVQLWGEYVSIDLFYPYSTDYDPGRKKAIHSGPMKNANLPRFSFRIPNIEQLKAIKILYHMMYIKPPFGQKREQTKQSDWKHKVDSTNIMKIDRNATISRRKYENKLNSKFYREIVKPLEEEWKYITREKKGKHYHIRFTENGKNIARILNSFEY